MSDLPEWLEKEMEKLLGDDSDIVLDRPIEYDFKLGFQKCYELIKNRQKLKPIESAPVEKAVLTRGCYFHKDSQLGTTDFKVGSFNDRREFFTDLEKGYDFIPEIWTELPLTQGGEG